LLIFTACIRLTAPSAFYSVSKEKRPVIYLEAVTPGRETRSLAF
jgi:hypothetical protein